MALASWEARDSDADVCCGGVEGVGVRRRLTALGADTGAPDARGECGCVGDDDKAAAAGPTTALCCETGSEGELTESGDWCSGRLGCSRKAPLTELSC